MFDLLRKIGNTESINALVKLKHVILFWTWTEHVVFNVNAKNVHIGIYTHKCQELLSEYAALLNWNVEHMNASV